MNPQIMEKIMKILSGKKRDEEEMSDEMHDDAMQDERDAGEDMEEGREEDAMKDMEMADKDDRYAEEDEEEMKQRKKDMLFGPKGRGLSIMIAMKNGKRNR